MVYYPQTPAEALHEGIRDELQDYPQVRSRLLSESAQIGSALTFVIMRTALQTFNTDVDALRGTKLTDAQADYLIALAQATADARIFPPVPPPRPCAPHCV
jgi:hypothetical protein